MASIDTLLAADAAAVFLTDFADTVTYTPASGSARSIKAVVRYNPPEMVGPGGEVIMPKVTITVANNATTGIPVGTMNVHGADTVTLADRQGGRTITLPVFLPPAGTMMTHDAGMVTLYAR